jgi:hypothetical protein
MSTAAWRRVRAGYYVSADGLTHIAANPAEDGGGWVVIYPDGETSEPVPTLRDAKAAAVTPA